MKLLGYCLLCLFVARAQTRTQLTKLFKVEGPMTNGRQLSNTTKPLDRFFNQLRATYNFVFHQSDNVTNVEKVLARNASNPDLQALKLIWSNPTKASNLTTLRYPDNSLFDQVISLSTLKNHESKTNSPSLEKDSSVQMKTTIRTVKSSLSSSGNSPSKTKTLSDDDWFNDAPPLDQLELQDEELGNRNDMEIVTPGTTLQFSATAARHLVEWLGSLLRFTYGMYTKLSGAACGREGNAIK